MVALTPKLLIATLSQIPKLLMIIIFHEDLTEAPRVDMPDAYNVVKKRLTYLL